MSSDMSLLESVLSMDDDTFYATFSRTPTTPTRLYELGRDTPNVLRQSWGETYDLAAPTTANGDGRCGTTNTPALTQDTQTVNHNEPQVLDSEETISGADRPAALAMEVVNPEKSAPTGNRPAPLAIEVLNPVESVPSGDRPPILAVAAINTVEAVSFCNWPDAPNESHSVFLPMRQQRYTPSEPYRFVVPTDAVTTGSPSSVGKWISNSFGDSGFGPSSQDSSSSGDASGRAYGEPDLVTSPSQLQIRILPHQTLFFTGREVGFTLQVINFPPGIPLIADTVIVGVLSPIGLAIPVILRQVGRMNVLGTYTFYGSFVANHQPGTYTITARIYLFPLTGLVEESMTLQVCRDYYGAFMTRPDNCFQLVRFREWHLDPYIFTPRFFQGRQQQLSAYKVWGMACNRATNRLYYINCEQNSLLCVTPEGRIIVNRGATRNMSLKRPVGMAHDTQRNRIIIPDKDNHRMCFFSMDGQLISSFGRRGDEDGCLYYPWDVDVTNDGSRIVVADANNYRVQMFDWQGNYLGKFASPLEERDQFLKPRGVTFDNTGNRIYIADYEKSSILELSLDLQSHTRILQGRNILHPQGLTVDPNGTLVVCDSGNKSVVLWNPMQPQNHKRIRICGNHSLRLTINAAVMGDDRLAILDNEANLHII